MRTLTRDRPVKTYSFGMFLRLAFAVSTSIEPDVLLLDEIVAEKHGTAPETTNNRMELLALIEAYRLLPLDARVSVYSDSQLCVKTINEWAAGWEARGWKRKSGPIKNLDLVQELWALAQARPSVAFKWIKAHDGSRWNEYADALASAYQRR